MKNESLPFATPQDELDYLRSKVLEQEQKLGQSEHAKSRDQLIRQSVVELKESIPFEIKNSTEVLQTVHEVKGGHIDDQLNEVIQLTEVKGIVHALSVIEKLEDWKHEDDFHDYLVNLVKQGLPTRGVEKGPLYRALSMTLFEVVMPTSEKKDAKESLKTLISSMEQFYSGMISVSEKETMGKNYLVLEIANSNGSNEFVFYVSVPNERKNLLEKQLISVFPDARLIERDHDYNIFVRDGKSAASVASLAQPSAMPLKTFESFDHDPLNAILSSFSKIPKDGSGAAIQIIFNPHGENYTKRYTHAIKEIEKGVKTKDAIAERSLMQEFTFSIGEAFFTKEKKDSDKPKPVDTVALEHIRRKLESPTISTNIRIVTSSHDQKEAEHILSEIESSFNQFEIPGVNKFVFKRIKSGANFYRNFSFRLFSESEIMPLNLKELTSILHFHTANLTDASQLKQVKTGSSPAPMNLPQEGTLLGVNSYHNIDTQVFLTDEDRLRHIYTIGQTGTGKTTLLKNMIIQDIEKGNGVCMIDPHGSDILDVLAHIPANRLDDVVYFDPSHTDRPMGLNMLEYDRSKPEQKTFVVNELFSIFQKLYGAVPESMGPMFEQYFRNATMLVIEDPDSGSTLLDVSRVLSNKEFRQMKLSKCKNPIVVQFWTEIAEKAGGEGALANIVPYITSKFDVFLANEIMRPIVAQEKSAFNFREIMDGKKILLVNLSKGRLGDINANLIGLIIVGKILMAALSRVDMVGKPLSPFYLYIDEFQNITTPSISTILSEARKYKLSLFMAHQFIAQLSDDIKNSVFGNVGNMIVYRVGADDAEYLVKQFEPIFTASQIMNIDNYSAYVKLLVHGKPSKPFNIRASNPPAETGIDIESIKQLSYLKYGRKREEVEAEIMEKYKKPTPATPLVTPKM